MKKIIISLFFISTIVECQTLSNIEKSGILKSEKGAYIVLNRSIQGMQSSESDSLVDLSDSKTELTMATNSITFTKLTIGYNTPKWNLEWTYGDNGSLSRIGSALGRTSNILTGKGTLSDYVGLMGTFGLFGAYVDNQRYAMGKACFTNNDCQPFFFNRIRTGITFKKPFLELFAFNLGIENRYESSPKTIAFGSEAAQTIDVKFPLYNDWSNSYGFTGGINLLPLNLEGAPNLYGGSFYYLGFEKSRIQEHQLPIGWKINSKSMPDVLLDFGLDIGIIFHILNNENFKLNVDANAGVVMSSTTSNATVITNKNEIKDVMYPSSNITGLASISLLASF